jgi:hypothetical protein
MWAKWKLILVYLEIVLISTQDRCTICAKRTIGSESFWSHLIVHLGDVDQAKAHFNPFGYSFNLSTRQVHDLRRMYHMHGNGFKHT